MKHTCRDCKFFSNNPAWLEREFPGMNALSSAYSTIRGEAGVCMKRDLYLSPVNSCRDFILACGDDHFPSTLHT